MKKVLLGKSTAVKADTFIIDNEDVCVCSTLNLWISDVRVELVIATFVAGSVSTIHWMQFELFCLTLEFLLLRCSFSSSAEFCCASNLRMLTMQQLRLHWLVVIDVILLRLLNAGYCLSMAWWLATFSAISWLWCWWEHVVLLCHQ